MDATGEIRLTQEKKNALIKEMGKMAKLGKSKRQIARMALKKFNVRLK